MPEIWPEPLPRFAALPGDPPALRRWLRRQRDADPQDQYRLEEESA
jgi:hypothetical protein